MKNENFLLIFLKKSYGLSVNMGRGSSPFSGSFLKYFSSSFLTIFSIKNENNPFF